VNFKQTFYQQNVPDGTSEKETRLKKLMRLPCPTADKKQLQELLLYLYM
jgi:hypothetical protein